MRDHRCPRGTRVAVYRYAGMPQAPVSYVGLLPTDYYPSDVATVGNRVVVTNTRGIDARGPGITTNKGYGVPVVSGHDTHSTTASLTSFTLPSDKEIDRYTATQRFVELSGTPPGPNTRTTDSASAASPAVVAVPWALR